MTSKIPISDLDWWQFNMGESGYREKKKPAQISEQINDLGIGIFGLYSQSWHWPIVLHQFLFSFFSRTKFLYLGGRTELKRTLLCLWAKTAPSANSTLSNVKWTCSLGERDQAIALTSGVQDPSSAPSPALGPWILHCWLHGHSASTEEWREKDCLLFHPPTRSTSCTVTSVRGYYTARCSSNLPDTQQLQKTELQLPITKYMT